MAPYSAWPQPYTFTVELLESLPIAKEWLSPEATVLTPLRLSTNLGEVENAKSLGD